MINRIAILGTGLLGTSAGLALRAAGFTGTITGWNRGAEGAQTALAMGAIDSIATDPLQAARESRVVLLSGMDDCQILSSKRLFTAFGSMFPSNPAF